MVENQENKNSIIESYDGDPDDLVFFQPPEVEEEDLEEELPNPEEEVVFDRETDGFDEEMVFNNKETAFNIENTSKVNCVFANMASESGNRAEGKDIASEQTETIMIDASTEKLTSTMARSGGESVSRASGEIDLNDPHYANFEWDPYYDFGYGTEPEAKGMNEKKEASTLGTVSFCTGIGSVFLVCCGMQYILSLAALVTGIWCLCMKGNSRSTKTFAIIGIICACLPYVFLILNTVFQIALPVVLGI